MNTVYDKVLEFKKKYPATIAWRTKAHCKVIEMHLNPGEEVLYAFIAQKKDEISQMNSTYVVALTNKRLMLAQKKLLSGYLLLSITPDLFNDLTVDADMLWGTIVIDTIKEQIKLTSIQKEALPEIETAITQFMMDAKQKYGNRETI